MNCISCLMVCQIFFSSEFPNITEKSQQGKKTNSKTTAKLYSLQVNAINNKLKFIVNIVF